MKNINSFSILIIIIFLFSFASLFSQDNLPKWRIQVAEKEQQLSKLNLEINNVQQKKNQIELSLANTEKDRKDKKNVYDKAKDAYERASKNVDLISADNLTNLLQEYKSADEKYKNTQDKEQELKNEKSKLESDIERLKDQKRKQEIQILELRAKMLDEEMSKPVWSQGSGESILDENKTIKECKRLALEYAKRDAMDKGGKTIIESVTKVEDFVLIKDEIKSNAKLQVVEQDLSGDFGQAIRVMHGDMIKYTAKVRLKLKSIDSFNPYRLRINELKGESSSNDVKYITDNFNSEKINDDIWEIINFENRTTILQQNGFISISEVSANPGFAWIRTKTIEPKDFWISIKVKIGSGNKGNVQLTIDNGHDDNNHSSFSVMFEQWTTKGVWQGLVHKKATNLFRLPNNSKVQPLFGDESYKFHTFKIIYDNNLRKAIAYIDNIYLGEEYLDWSMDIGLRIGFSAWNGGENIGKSIIYFDDFNSNIPLIN